MFTDFIINGAGTGELGERLQGVRFDPGLLRPFIDSRGRRCVTVNMGVDRKTGKTRYKTELVSKLHNLGIPTVNAVTSLRKDEWLKLDNVVLGAARERLRAWADLSAASSFGGFNGMSKMILEHETMNDPGEAVVDFDGLTEGRTDSPQFQLEGLPLPITHSDFWFSSRRLAVSRNSSTPLDTTMGECAGRRVAETIEKTLIGTVVGPTYGRAADYARASRVFGYTNFPDRITKTNLTTPTGSNGDATVEDVLAMKDLASAQNFYGPFMLYHSNDWDRYMDDDYRAQDSRTLRQRLREISGIQDVRRLDFLKSTTNPFTLLMVQMTGDVARAVNGMDITTVQWESMGGMRLNFKVMCIMVPQLRADFSGNCGIVHGTTA